MNGITSALQNLVSALGGRDASEPGNPYVLGDDGLGCLRDIKRWLQHFDEKKDVWDVKSALATMNVVGNDLCPILAQWTISESDNEIKRRICLACVEILVPITWPLELDQDSDDFKVRQFPNLKLAQTNYKHAILFDPEHDILSSVMRVAYPSLAIPRRERSQRDLGIIRLVIYLLRNLAAIDEDSNRGDTILAFVKANVLDFLCVLASGMGEDFLEEDVIALDTIYRLVRGVETRSLYEVSSTRTDTVNRELTELLEREKDMRTTNKKQAHSRHNRFGTMVSVVQNSKRFTVPSQTAILQSKSGNNFDGIEARKKWHKPQTRIQSQDDVEKRVNLGVEARLAIAGFTTTFLEAGFNPLFLSILKAIESDDARVSPANRLQFLYLQGWFLRALREQGLSARKKEKKSSDFQDDADYELIAGMMTSRATIMLRKMLSESIDLKVWKEAHAAMNCFKELLLTIESMSLSSDADYQEIAENLQSNLYYEETTLDLVARCVRTYTNQSLGYLDACTDLASVLLKMLEKYASTKTHMFVRARRQRQKKRGKNTQEAAQDSDDETAEAAARDAVKERAFSFARFEDKFINEHSLDTFAALLEFYADLNSEQIKRAITFFHRVFVKLKIEILLYRMNIFELLHRMLKDEIGLSKRNAARLEVENFTIYMMKRFQKAIVDYPALAWEVLFEKMSKHPYYLTHEENKPPQEQKVSRPPAEFEIRPSLGLSHEEQIRIAVAILLEQNKSDTLNWLKPVLSDLIDKRRAWEAEQRARDPESDVDVATIPVEPLSPDSPEIKTQLFKDGKLRLLLKLIKLERVGDRFDADALWIVPANIDIDQLQVDLNLIKKFTYDQPTFEDDKTAMDFIRREVAKKQSYDTDSSLDSSSEDEDFQVKTKKASRIRKPRQRQVSEADGAQLDDEEVDARRQKRKDLEELRKSQIKSSKYVNDSDDEDDEAANALFFAAEAALRERQQMKAAQHLSAPVAKSTKKQPKAKAVPINESSDKENENARRASSVLRDSSEAESDSGTNQTSPVSTKGLVRGNKRAARMSSAALFTSDNSASEAEDSPKRIKLSRRKIVDSDDD